MNIYNSIADFTGRTLVIPDKTDIERDAVAKVWEEHGGNVVRIDRFWDPPNLEYANISLYGNHLFCLVLAQKLNLVLVSPPDDLLMNIDEKWLKRAVRITTIAKCGQICYPCFIKPLVPKIFIAQTYFSYSELMEECKQLDEGTPVIVSEIVEISAEVRAFVLNGSVCGVSEYEGEADLRSAMDFLEEFISSNFDVIPKTCVVDIGYINKKGWAVIEANAVWGAGLNGCYPLAVAMCIAEATMIGEE